MTVDQAERHPFTTIFLVLFLLDGVRTVGVGAGYLRPDDLFDPDDLEFLLMPFGIAMFLGSMVQVTLAFLRRMRLFARLIGLYVILFYWVFPGIGLMVYYAIQGAAPAAGSEPAVSGALSGWLNLALGSIQVALGAWATRDLSRGHFLPAP